MAFRPRAPLCNSAGLQRLTGSGGRATASTSVQLQSWRSGTSFNCAVYGLRGEVWSPVCRQVQYFSETKQRWVETMVMRMFELDSFSVVVTRTDDSLSTAARISSPRRVTFAMTWNARRESPPTRCRGKLLSLAAGLGLGRFARRPGPPRTATRRRTADSGHSGCGFQVTR